MVKRVSSVPCSSMSHIRRKKGAAAAAAAAEAGPESVAAAADAPTATYVSKGQR